MKKLLILWIFCIMISYAFAQKAILQTDAQKMNLKGKVKSIREIAYYTVEKSDPPVKDEISEDGPNELHEFDASGNKITETYYYNDGAVNNYIKNKFSKPGLQIEEAHYDDKNALNEKRILEYDENNMVTKLILYDKAGIPGSPTLKKYTFKDPYNYSSVTTFPNGTILLDTFFKSKDNLFDYQIHIDKGYYKHSVWYNDGKQIVHTTSEFNPGKVRDESFFEYDEKGNVNKRTDKDIFSGRADITTQVYTYDSRGNWIKKIERTNGGEPTITERTIVYY